MYTYRKNGFFFISLILLLFFFSASAFAAPYSRFYTGVRPLGMGGAFTAVADDQNTIFYNPAGLSRINGLTIGLLNPAVGIGENGLDMIQDIDDTNMDDTGEVTELLRKYTGKHIHLHGSLTPHIGFRIKNFGAMVSAFAIANMDSQVRNPVYPEFHMDAHVDIGGIGGVGVMVPGGNNLRAGLSYKAISRESLREVYTPAQIAADNFDDILEDDRKSGSGSSFDLGLIYTLPWEKYFQTDIALVAQNLPSIEFDEGEKLETEWIAGVAIQKKLGPFALLAALDYRDFTKNIKTDNDIGKRLHMGAEIKFKELVSLRGGFNQGYPTLGAGLDLWILKFDAVMYSEEVGAYAGQREDKRYMGQLTIGW
ncbi:hypothetical protein LZ24_00850 [Desulfobotulus alkaliphilus]|uniref:F plasmid transfer operon protein TraF n=1 Tax=Desulfobotulus alkaliphilus TaxID=622671 RepID=A0A562S2M5_9BACT|nr:hypothetical protein [Desulfobotulus alkaliphilus]TWI75398.1 hypothetical protein LZ24_00850 [Desulfobotulus alkaliphilus]